MGEDQGPLSGAVRPFEQSAADDCCEPRITNAAKCMKVRCIAKSFGEVIRDTDFSDSEGDLTKLFL